MKRQNYCQLNQISYSKNPESFKKLEEIGSYLAYRDLKTIIAPYLSKRMTGKSIKILDIGCSIGTSISYFSDAVKQCGFTPHVTGIDLNFETLQIARTRFPEFQFKHVSAEDSLAYLGKFDLIICNFVLVEMQTSAMHALLVKARMLLEEQGVMIITSPTLDIYNPQIAWYAINNRFPNNFSLFRKNVQSSNQNDIEDQSVTLQVIDPKTNEEIVTFHDFLHSQDAYSKAYQFAGLHLLGQHFPLGTDEDNIPWISEKEKNSLKDRYFMFKLEDMGKLLLRLNVGILMLMHGIHKLKFGIDDIKQWIVEMGGPDFLAYGIFIPEVIAPVCLILGFFVRSASFVLALNMCLAILYLHTKGYLPFKIDDYGGFKAEIDVLYLLSFCALMFLGGGKYALQFSTKPFAIKNPRSV